MADPGIFPVIRRTDAVVAAGGCKRRNAVSADICINEVCNDELSLNEFDNINGGFLPVLLAAAELAPAFLIGAAVGVGIGVATKYVLEHGV